MSLFRFSEKTEVIGSTLRIQYYPDETDLTGLCYYFDRIEKSIYLLNSVFYGPAKVVGAVEGTVTKKAISCWQYSLDDKKELIKTQLTENDLVQSS